MTNTDQEILDWLQRATTRGRTVTTRRTLDGFATSIVYTRGMVVGPFPGATYRESVLRAMEGWTP